MGTFSHVSMAVNGFKPMPTGIVTQYYYSNSTQTLHASLLSLLEGKYEATPVFSEMVLLKITLDSPSVPFFSLLFYASS